MYKPSPYLLVVFFQAELCLLSTFVFPLYNIAHRRGVTMATAILMASILRGECVHGHLENRAN